MRITHHLLWAAPAILQCASVHATQYLTIEQARQLLFSGATRFEDVSVDLTDQDRADVEKRGGSRQRWKRQSIWRAENQDGILGLVILDEVVGKHEFITYAVGIDARGQVSGVEILNYRETYGYQVRNPAWRARFVGKGETDALRLDDDIPNIAGATLSCRNVTNGVRRLLALRELMGPRLLR